MIAHVRPFSRKAARCRADQAGLVLGALQVAAGLVNIERRHQATFAFTISLILKRCNFLSRGIGVDFFTPAFLLMAQTQTTRAMWADSRGCPRLDRVVAT
jgi:hypothetical protein